VIHTLGSREPALSLRLAQLQRVSQQPHGIKARRPHLAGLKVTYCALAQVSPCCQLLLGQARPVPARPQERTERAGRQRVVDQLVLASSLAPAGSVTRRDAARTAPREGRALILPAHRQGPDRDGGACSGAVRLALSTATRHRPSASVFQTVMSLKVMVIG
jgi:hypothetical protein